MSKREEIQDFLGRIRSISVNMCFGRLWSNKLDLGVKRSIPNLGITYFLLDTSQYT